eukprot:TRINITY_DN3783_c0_g2_i3.p1 TRINITY_DN3783_c0_g2~~TRINITY_DN3783_c0_g2_i3.p1  ORF type:complete len:826 (-),score=182.08 TRINITY_DN3783_c0_g2_i3:157-2634(-)
MLQGRCTSTLNTNNRRAKQHRRKGMVADDDLEFDSEFEQGNLDLATKRRGEYNLFMRTDSNTKGHHQWFYFSVKNKREGTFKFNVLNFTKRDSLYQQGMRVAIYSAKKASLAKAGKLPHVFATWHRGGDNISYEISSLSEDNGVRSKYLARSGWKKAYYTLSFEYNFEYPEDVVSFAYAVPYTYTQLMELIKTLNPEYTKKDILCKSLGGVQISLLTITENNKEEYKKATLKEKPVVIAAARVHPGETCGSFMMEGFLRFITSSDAIAKELRSRFVFKVIPMVNPDGVILGNYRACLCGQDLNRNFSSPDSRLHPEICAIKELIAELHASSHTVLGYFDFHGHSKKKCVFVYGPHYPLHSSRYLQVRVFAKLLGLRTRMFRYRACKFREEAEKMTAARLVIAREFDIMNSFTIEASFYAFINEERKSVEFSHNMYVRMGEYIALAILDYDNLVQMEEASRVQRRFMRLQRKRKVPSKKQVKQEIEQTNKSSQEKPKIAEVIRIEDLHNHPELFQEKFHKPRNLKDIYESIREDSEKEVNLSPSDSDSAESEVDPLSKEEEDTAIKSIIAAVEGLPPAESPPIRSAAAQRNKLLSKKKSVKKAYESKLNANAKLLKNESAVPIKLQQNKSFYELNKGRPRDYKMSETIINTSSNSKAFPKALLSPERDKQNLCAESLSLSHAEHPQITSAAAINSSKQSYISAPMQRIVKREAQGGERKRNEMLSTSYYQNHIIALNSKVSLPFSTRALTLDSTNSRSMSNHKSRRDSGSNIGRTKYAERLKATKIIQGGIKEFYLTHTAECLKYYYANYKTSKRWANVRNALHIS